MRYLLASLLLLLASLGMLCAGIAGKKELLVVAPFVAWPSLILSAVLVQRATPRHRLKRLWAQIPLGFSIFAPFLSCAWMPFAYMGAALLTPRSANPDTPLLLGMVLPPMCFMGVMTGLALRTPIVLVVVVLGMCAVGATATMMNANDERIAVVVWIAIASVVLFHLVGARSSPDEETLAGRCPHCGYDVRGLPVAALCPECGLNPQVPPV